MNDKKMREFIDILYSYFKDKLEADGLLKNCVKRKNATVTSPSSNGGKSDVVFPYDTISFSVRNETGASLSVGDLVCLEYSNDLKNAVAVYIVQKNSSGGSSGGIY